MEEIQKRREGKPGRCGFTNTKSFRVSVRTLATESGNIRTETSPLDGDLCDLGRALSTENRDEREIAAG